MTRLFVALFAVLIAYRPATGASMEYCRPYAAQTVDLLVKYLWTRAYTSCLNADDDPAVAAAPPSALQSLVPIPDLTIDDPPPARHGRSGYAVNSTGWIAYCKRNWPASFDRKSGTVIKTGHRRIPCPG
jgi:hypothetical protein